MLMQEKLSGFLSNLTDDFTKAAQPLKAERLAMVERHRAARGELQALQEARLTGEARARSSRMRNGILGLWDRVTGQRSRLKRQNEEEATAARERDAQEKQTLIEHQLRERQYLQREIGHSRRTYLREVTRLHRQLAEYQRLGRGMTEGGDNLQAGEERRQRRSQIQRERSGPS